MHRSYREKDYREARRAGYRPNVALDHARTLHRWRIAEDAGLVRLRVAPDDITLDDVAPEWGDPEDWPGGRRAQEAAQKALRESIERDGVWGIVGEYRTSPDGEWESGDGVWGFVGDPGFEPADDYYREFGNGYAADIQWETLRQLVEALRSRPPRCHCCGVRAA